MQTSMLDVTALNLLIVLKVHNCIAFTNFKQTKLFQDEF